MTNSTKDKKERLQDNFGIWTCDYPPQENKSGLAEFTKSPCSFEYATQEKFCTVVADDYHSSQWDIFSNKYLDSLLNSSFSKEDDNKTLELIFQTITEHSHEMLPLLNLLREKSEEDNRIAKLLEDLEAKLGLQARPDSPLAPRELEVLELVVQGKSNREIAAMLEIKIITVGKTLTRVYRKLNAKNRSDAVFKWSMQQSIG